MPLGQRLMYHIEKVIDPKLFQILPFYHEKLRSELLI